ncbi:LOW QUALITY PROTEIN: hypothetical protein KUF71_006054 [Frankliniella fusca]|uniref:Uncharacterized protein n=1 Tax=Frankliniella fusca TaxID=407009 RepID=A0AAE1H753_9NEOP|nr:LOW QUALITY PROTEIN: hypothetical protein KUF71_006054 [Frankliniella fusca]
MRLKFHRNSNQFMLMSSSNEKLKITKMYLLVRKVLPSSAVRLGHVEALLVSSAKYPIRRTGMKTVSITAGLQDKSIDNLYLGPTPQRITIGFVDNKAYNGDYKLNGFKFQHFNVNYLCLHIRDSFRQNRLRLILKTGSTWKLFSSIFSGTGIHFKDAGNYISRNDYPNGYCFYVFDLTYDLSANDGHWNVQRQGTVRLDVRFKEPLQQPINCVIMAEFHNLIEIDRHRNVIVDFSN